MKKKKEAKQEVDLYGNVFGLKMYRTATAAFKITFILKVFFPVLPSLLTDRLIQVIQYNPLIHNLAKCCHSNIFHWYVNYQYKNT